MQIVLLQEEQVSFRYQNATRNVSLLQHNTRPRHYNPGSQQFTTLAANVSLSPVLTGGESAAILTVFQTLGYSSQRNMGRPFSFSMNNSNARVEIGVTEENTVGTAYSAGNYYDEYNGYAYSEGKNNVKFYLRVCDLSDPGGLLHHLSNSFGQRLKLKVDLCNIEGSRGVGRISTGTSSSNPFNLLTNEEDVLQLPSTGLFGCEKTDIDIAGQRNLEFRNNMNTGRLIGTLKITAIIKDEFSNPPPEPLPKIEDKLSVNKKLLKEEICCDATIIAGNGVSIKCHKSFLAAQSLVFQTMFQGSMKETRTSTVEILDMTEASVRAFLGFLYYWDTKEAKKNSLICFELFHAGHKYDIAKLEEFMKQIMLSKDNKWYDVDVAMRLFLFARNMEDASELKVKAIQVLKSKFSILEQSQSYQELFKKDPKAAMELCKYAFSV